MLKILAKEYVCYLREPRLGRQDGVFRTDSLSITLAFNCDSRNRKCLLRGKEDSLIV